MLRSLALAFLAALGAAVTAFPLPARAEDSPKAVFTPLPHQFAAITEIANAGDSSGRLYVVEQRGTIRVVQANGSLAPGFFLDIRDRVGDSGSEQGLLGLAFSPSFETDRTFYVNYTDNNGDTVVARYLAVSGVDADESSALQIFFVQQPAANHNGGHLAFGPDGWLYIGMGDGGGSGDPDDRAQDDSDPLGKLLRYNPASGALETWAKGLRNPWKFSFDRATGDLFIADVGQNAWEEVNFLPAGAPSGLNFGWDRMEGSHCFPALAPCDITGLVLPVVEHSHSEGCSVTGGFVVRQPGSALDGIYVFSDYCSAVIWGLRRNSEGRWEREKLGELSGNVPTFGEGEDGTLYVAEDTGPFSRILMVSGEAPLPPLPFRRVLPGLAAD